MPRKTPTLYVETLGEFDTEPVKSIADYFSSKACGQLSMKPALSNTIGSDFSSFYVDAKIENELTHKATDFLCHKQVDHESLNEMRLKVAKADQAELEEKFIKLNSIMRDLGDKRKISKTKIDKEVKRQKELSAMIESRAKSIDELIVFREKLKATTEQYKIYEKVLHEAVQKNTNFESIEDMIMRCDAIMYAQMDIDNLNQTLITEIAGMQKRVLDIIKQGKFLVLGLKNSLIYLKHSFNATVAERLRWERIYSHVVDVRISNELKKERIWDALYTLYRLLCKRRGVHPVYGRRPVEKALDFIQDEVDLLKETLKTYNRRNKISSSAVIKIKPKC